MLFEIGNERIEKCFKRALDLIWGDWPDKDNPNPTCEDLHKKLREEFGDETVKAMIANRLTKLAT